MRGHDIIRILKLERDCQYSPSKAAEGSNLMSSGR